ncbi:hypothetical protein V8C42DRAFT_360540 [Trichoderma barbatum]
MFSTFYQSRDAATAAQRNSATACYACRFKKVKCPNERPGCRRCEASNMICQYPTPKSASSRRKSSASKDNSECESIEPDPERLPNLRRDSTNSQRASNEAGEQGRSGSNSRDPTPAEIHTTHSQDFIYTNEANWSNEGMDNMDLFCHNSFGSFSPSLADDDLPVPQFILPSPHETIPSPSSNMRQTISDATLNSNKVSGEFRNGCECNSVILGRLEHILDWVEHKCLLETLLALRDNVEHFRGLSQCSYCHQSSRSTLLLIMFAEKLVDQLRDLLISNKRLSTNDNEFSIRFADYVTRSRQECSTLYFALLRLHTRNLRAILAGLLGKALEWGWTGQAATLKVLTARVEGVNRDIARQTLFYDVVIQ